MPDIYTFTVLLTVEVDAFEESDAYDVLEEYFGGDGIGAIAIKESKIVRKYDREV